MKIRFATVTPLAAFILLTNAIGTAQNSTTQSHVKYPSAYAISQPLTELPTDKVQTTEVEALPVQPSPLISHHGANPTQPDSLLRTQIGPLVATTKGVSFDGVGANGGAPSDVNLAIGPNDIVQTVNTQFAIYTKGGTLLTGPTNFTSFFAKLGGDCAAGGSDPIVLYDKLADRWLLSIIGIGSSTFSECVGVSTTNDPTKTYTLYKYSFGTKLPDYPKLGVWSTASNGAYLATYNIFAPSFTGADLCGMDRTKMLAGDPTAAQLCVTTPNSEGSYLPSDLDGATPPTDGTPGFFLTWQNNNPGQLFLRKLTLNFGAGTATLSAATTISVANSALACGNGGTCVQQKGTTQTLDTLGDRLMYRLAYRKFSDHEKMVVDHSVGSGSSVAVRWYEIWDPSGAVTLNQQGTFAPDATFRWMGSTAMDQAGDIAIGYSASSSTLNPAIRFTGRVPSDPSGTMEAEDSLLVGTGSQNGGLSRWGDYTAMRVDPSDDCTFWYTNQYEKVSGSFNWSTFIGSFVFTNCGGGGGGAPAVTLSLTTWKFSGRPVGTTSSAKAVTLTNSGTATLNISSIVASGDFSQTNTCGSSVAAGATCTIKIKFTPTAIGVRTGAVTITDNASPTTQTITLSGKGK
jgi:hypothetical protein